MILGLTHVGLTVREVDKSVRFYREVLGSEVLSDAERKGEVADRITGIRGIHTRTVYVSMARYEHFELFQFYNPETFSEKTNSHLQAGILYCAVVREGTGSLPALKTSTKNERWSDLVQENEGEPHWGSRAVTIRDPDELLLRIVKSRPDQRCHGEVSGDRLFYAAIVVAELETSLAFYQEVLGLTVAGQGLHSPIENSTRRGKTTGRVHWVILKAPAGVCLKLIQPLDCEVYSASPWRMEKVGFTHVAFGVRNLERYHYDLSKKGVSFFSPPQILGVGPHRNGGCVYLRTPDGVTVEFLDSPLVHKQAAQIGGMTGEI